jgi:hypothetical protein
MHDDQIVFLKAATCPPAMAEKLGRITAHQASNGERVNLSGPGPYRCSRAAFDSVRKAYRGAFILPNRPTKPVQTGAATVPPTAAPAPTVPTPAATETAPAKMDPMDGMDKKDTTAAKAAPKGKGKNSGKGKSKNSGKGKGENPAPEAAATEEPAAQADSPQGDEAKGE